MTENARYQYAPRGVAVAIDPAVALHLAHLSDGDPAIVADLIAAIARGGTAALLDSLTDESESLNDDAQS